jgi:hypothetical protein
MRAGSPATVCETIDIASGTAKRKVLLKEDQIKLRFYSNVFLQTTPDKAIIYTGDGGKNDQLGVITLE